MLMTQFSRLLYVPEDVYNIAGNDIVSMQRLVEMMVNVFEKDFKYDILDKTFGVDNVPDIAKAEDRIGFVPEVSLENGLRSLKGE